MTGARLIHGTARGYWRGCTCEACRYAHAVYIKKLTVRHRRGQVWADLDHYRAVLGPFLARGVTVNALAQATGVSAGSLQTIIEGDGRVGVEVAARLDGLTWADLPDVVQVDAAWAHEIIGHLRARGVTWKRIGQAHGWVNWPGPKYPAERCALGMVRDLRRLLDEVTRPACARCGATPMAGGKWCGPCFTAVTAPKTRREVEVAARRERDRLKKRAERARQGATA